MMRYQRVSPDCVPLSTANGKKPNGGAIHQSSPPPPPPPPSTTTTTSTNNVNLTPSSSSFEPNKALRFRSPSRTPDHNTTTTNNHFETNSNGFHSHNNHSNNHHYHHHHHHHETTTPQQRPEGSPSEKLLQWGQRKRSRASRTEIRALTDDSSSSSSAQARQHSFKPQRRLVGPTTTAAAAMPPPPPPPPPPPSSSAIPSSSSNGRARKESSGSLLNRNLEDRSGVVNGSPSRNSGGVNSRVASRSTAVGKRSPPPEKSERKLSSSARTANERPNGSAAQADRVNHIDSALVHHELETRNNNSASCAPKDEKASSEVIEWPRIQIPLSRKEKEDDFLVMKGTKLPQRPKKRAKTVERSLQFCFPGMWLPEVSKSRYEVKEKKCVKKQQKRRGLKGMESLDSDSE